MNVRRFGMVQTFVETSGEVMQRHAAPTKKFPADTGSEPGGQPCRCRGLCRSGILCADEARRSVFVWGEGVSPRRGSLSGPHEYGHSTGGQRLREPLGGK